MLVHNASGRAMLYGDLQLARLHPLAYPCIHVDTAYSAKVSARASFTLDCPHSIETLWSGSHRPPSEECNFCHIMHAEETLHEGDMHPCKRWITITSTEGMVLWGERREVHFYKCVLPSCLMKAPSRCCTWSTSDLTRAVHLPSFLHPGSV